MPDVVNITINSIPKKASFVTAKGTVSEPQNREVEEYNPLRCASDFDLSTKYDRLEYMAQRTKQQLFDIILRLEPEIRALGVIRLSVFGSFARGEDRPDSDVDILVQFSKGSKTFERFLALSELLESSLGRRIELVTTEALSPFIGPHILAEAQDVIRAA